MELKRCPDCKEVLPKAYFGTQGLCKDCNYARVKKWRAENPEKTREQDRRRHRKRVRRASVSGEALEDLRFFERTTP